MKRLFLFAVAAICCFAVSCSKQAELSLVTSTSLEFEEEGGEADVQFTSNVAWAVSSSETWVNVDPAAGSASDAVQTVTVTVAPSTSAEARTATVTVDAGDKQVVINVSQAGKTVYTDITNNANCYLINEGGNYCFDATTIGNGSAGILNGAHTTSATISPAGAKLVWEEVEGLVKGVKLEDGKLCFKLKEADGNALVAATDAAGNVLWSWHIWSVERVGTVALGPWTVMDRNLGAIGNSASDGEDAFGMYYQWGRKDPFSRLVGFTDTTYPCDGPDPAINTIAYSVSHPDSYIAAPMPQDGGTGNWILDPKDTDRNLWGAAHDVEGWLNATPVKTIYDPCPGGYMLMAPQTTWNYTPANVDGGITVGDENGSIFIPNSSFIYTVGHGWWDPYATLWTSSSAAWGDVNNEAFRIVPGDCHMNYGRGFAQPVRCMVIPQ